MPESGVRVRSFAPSAVDRLRGRREKYRVDQDIDLRLVQPRALRKIAALVLATLAEQLAHALHPELVELVDRPEHGQPPAGVVLAAEPDRLHDAVEHLPVVDLDDVLPARDADRLQRIGGHHADLGVGCDRGRAHRVRVELHELAEAPRPRLLVAEHPARAIAAVGFRQRVEVLRHVPGKRRGQIVAQRQPLLVVVLEREHASFGRS